MDKAELQQQAVALIKQLSTEELNLVVDLLVNLQNKQERNMAHSVEPNVKIAIRKIKKDYDRAWKTLAKM